MNMDHKLVRLVICGNNAYPHRAERLQELEQVDEPLRFASVEWIRQHCVNNPAFRSQTTHGLNSPHIARIASRQHHFSMRGFCSVIGPCVTPSCLTRAIYLQFLQAQLPQFVDDSPTATHASVQYMHVALPEHFGG
jgi:hypothetical protein